MAQIFTALLLTSGIGTALALILTLLKPITRKVFSGGWHYYMWLVVLLVMILPIRLNLPEKPVTTPPISETETVTITDNQIENTETLTIDTQPELITPEQPEKVSTIQAIKNFLITNIQLFSLIWVICAVLLFLIKVVSYLVFLIKIHKHSEIISCPEVKAYTNRRIKTRVSDTICSPLMIGIVRPTLLLPKTNITPEQLHNVLAHEMTHLKRNDILYKWFISIVKCIHWFNPAIYFIGKQINIDCEISCDLAVVKEMDEQQEKGYVETILSLLTHNNSKAIPLTTGMTGNKETLKRRFTMIKNRKRIGKITQILSTILAVVILATTVFTSGVLATAVFEDNSNIHFTCNGKVIDFTNKPFYENNTVYLPIRELFEKIGVMDNEENKIVWDNGKVYVTIVGNATTYYMIEINNNLLGISHNRPFTNTSQMTMSISLTTSPAILRNGATYIPYDFVDYMLNRGMVSHIENGPYKITCIVKGEPNLAYITPTFTWPSESETISNAFGKRVHPITGEERIHNGIDISAPENSPVISATYGEVIDTGYDKEFGNYIIIENDNGVKVYYGHLSAVEVAKGDKVKQRAVIGKVGKTGTATGANLHFEIQINGEYYNPELFWSNSNTGTINASFSTSVAETYEKTPFEQVQEDFGNSEVVVTNYYYKLDDGSWKSGDYTYKYRLVLTGRLNNAVKDSGYVVLSNTKDITFEQAWKASGLSSNSNDYFNPEEAVIVEIK